MPGPRGRVVVGTEIVALGVIGFSANCLVVMANTIGIEKQNPGALARGWGLIHIFLGIMMVVVGVATVMTSAVLGNDAISGFFGTALAWFGFFWIFFGSTLVLGADLRPVGHISIPFAIVDLWFTYGSLSVYQKLGISGAPGQIGPGLYSFTILLVILTVVFILLWPGTHGKAGALKVNAYLLIILALLGFYIAFGFFFPGFPGGALPF